MMKKLLSATAIVVFSSAAALAQTGTTAPQTPRADTTAGITSWDQSTRDAFFSADATLRPEAELRSGWQSLGADQQAEVRLYCDSVAANTTAGTGVTEDAGANAAVVPPRETTGSLAAGAAAPGAAAMANPDLTSVQQLCSNVQSF